MTFGPKWVIDFFEKEIFSMKMLREGPQLRVDAYGVRGCTRSYRQVNLPLRRSFAHYCEGRTGPGLLQKTYKRGAMGGKSRP